jgi:hypothetical protein
MNYVEFPTAIKTVFKRDVKRLTPELNPLRKAA